MNHRRYSYQTLKNALPHNDPLLNTKDNFNRIFHKGSIGLCTLIDFNIESLSHVTLKPPTTSTSPLYIDKHKMHQFYIKWFCNSTLQNYYGHDIYESTIKLCKPNWKGILLEFKKNESQKKMYNVIQSWLSNTNRPQLKQEYKGVNITGNYMSSMLESVPLDTHSCLFCDFNYNNIHLLNNNEAVSYDLLFCFRITKQSKPSNRRKILIDCYDVSNNSLSIVDKSDIGSILHWIDNIIGSCIDYINHKHKYEYPFFFGDNSDSTSIKLVTEIGQISNHCSGNMSISATKYYFHHPHIPTRLQRYLAAGHSMYQDIKTSIANNEDLFHEFHKCLNCNQCHSCVKCGCCLIHPEYCINCQQGYISRLDLINNQSIWDECFQCLWNKSNVIFINQQKYYQTGLIILKNIWNDKEIADIQKTATKINGGTYNDKTQDKSQNRIKNFLGGGGYDYTSEQKTDPMFNYGAAITTQVASIPHEAHDQVIKRLEQVKLITRNACNALAINFYFDGKKGIASHLDERTKFHEAHPIHVLRLFSAIYMRFGTVRFGQNPMFLIPFDTGDVLQMNPWFAGSDWIKHSIDIKDINGTTASIMIRRIRPVLLLMSYQKQLFHK